MAARAARGTQDIPSGQNFSPSEIELPVVLELATQNEGDRDALKEAIRQRFYADRTVPPSGGTVWANVVSGMVVYGLLDNTATLTEVGRKIYELRNDEAAMYEALAKHLLLNLNGIAVIECLRELQAAGETVTLVTIREALERRGFHTALAGKSVSLIALWLRKANLFRSARGWAINMPVYHRLLDRTEQEIGALAGLSPAQKAVLRMLAKLGPGNYDSSELRKMAQRQNPDVKLNEKQFPGDVLNQLRDLGYIELTKKGGRGWSQDVKPTQKTHDEVTVPLLDQIGDLDPKLRELLAMNFTDIVAKLDADTYEKGLALEALGFKLMDIVGLSYVGTRVRPSTGRFEVDLLFDSDRLAYSRWQVQCKNTQRVSLDDVAKEVGLTYHLLSNVIVILTRGAVGQDARTYAADVMRKTNLAIVLIEADDVDEIVRNPLYIFDVLAREAAEALHVKPLDTAGFASIAEGFEGGLELEP